MYSTVPLYYNFTMSTQGTTLHWMKLTARIYFRDGPLAAVSAFYEYLYSIRSLLTKLTSYSSVVFKLQDHLQDDSKFTVRNLANIDLYNSLAKDLLSGTNVTTWDSTIPLSDLYAQQCKVNPRHTDDNKWKCQDKTHVGYIIIEKYVDMLLNFVCNEFFNVTDDFCP
ncbi:hypothetical protein Hamer_G003501 [Homarus americanus]|uniref:Uncharacterized protein n=1 Tax=Homarus americanus TaxID=6706 RepID=A0A8J5MUZ8_HOMAM|nr:hypothetical protein Hamer_G003501 [Homarus americanus]